MRLTVFLRLRASADHYSLRITDARTDCNIRCGTRVWAVHRAVFSQHSRVLRERRESGLFTIDLSAYDPAVVEGLVNYIYGREPSPDFDNEYTKNSISMCALATEYEMRTVHAMAVEEVKTYTKYWGDSFLGDPQGAQIVADLLTCAYQGAEHSMTAVRTVMVEKIAESGVLGGTSSPIALKLAEVKAAYPEFASDVDSSATRRASRGSSTSTTSRPSPVATAMAAAPASSPAPNPTAALPTPEPRIRRPSWGSSFFACPACATSFPERAWERATRIHHCPVCDRLMTPGEWSGVRQTIRV